MVTQMAMPVPYHYQLIIRNGNDQYLVDPLEGVQVTRGIDGIPSKMTFKVMTDGILQFEEGNSNSMTILYSLATCLRNRGTKAV